MTGRSRTQTRILRVLAGLVTGAILLQHLVLMAGAQGPAHDAALDVSTTTPIKHFISVMQSNHTFDSLFGTYPGADGIPEDTCMPVDPDDPHSIDCVKPFPLTNNGADLDHSHGTFQKQYRDGQNDGFLAAYRARGEDGTLSLGHYTEGDLPFSYNAADEYVLYDRFFTSASAGSVPNRMFWMTGTAGIPSFANDSIPESGWGDLPTIFDLLEAKGVSWKFYIENYDPTLDFRNRGQGGTYAQVNWAPILSYSRYVDNPAYDDNIVDLNQYFVDLENNTLPAVSYVVTIGSSGHPPSNMLASERILQRMVNALMMSDAWDTSAIQWAFDDWGGWYDHVPPPQVDQFGYGFRTPAQLVSPYARRGYVDSSTLDFTSVLRFIQDNWSLPSLATRDSEASSIASGFDFSQAPRQAHLLSGALAQQNLVIPKRSAVYLTYTVALVSIATVVGGAFVMGHQREEVSS